MKLSIIIVNYKSYTHLLNCLESINTFINPLKALRNTFEVIIVNNDNNNLKPLPSYSFLNTKIINTNENIGFGVAHNLGSIMAKGEYLFLLNPDTVFFDDSLLQALFYMDNNTTVGILGLGIIDNTRNTIQNWICGKRSTWGNILFKNTINKPWNKKTPQKVDWVSGAALIIRKNLFKQLKGFDKNFFMYFEDQDLCLRAKELNKTVIHYPQSKLLHFNGQSWSDTTQKKNAYRKSQVYFFRKYNSFLGYFLLKLIYQLAAFITTFTNERKNS